MSPLTFGGKPVAGTRAAPGTAKRVDKIDKDAGGRVVLFMRLVAMALEARHQLVAAVEALREIDVEALQDPALQDHPRRPAMEQLYRDCLEAEHLAVIRLAEANVSLSRQWATIQTTDKNRYALTELIGADPDQDPLMVLWSDTCGLAKLVPFPAGWVVPHDISHRAFDPSMEIRDFTAEELFHAPSPPF